MKKVTIPSINLDEELSKIDELELSGGNYEGEDEPEADAAAVTKYYVNDMTAGRIIGPFYSYEGAYAAAERRQKKYPTHQIIIQQVSNADAELANGLGANLELRFWVLHYEKNRRYGPYYSFGTAQGVMNRKRKQYPGDRFRIEEEEFQPSMSAAENMQEVDLAEEEAQLDGASATARGPQLITVRVFFTAQGNGSFQAGRFNTANGDSAGWFPAKSPIRLSAKAAPGSKFSHWTFNGNFGGSDPVRTVPAKIGMRIVGVFV